MSRYTYIRIRTGTPSQKPAFADPVKSCMPRQEAPGDPINAEALIKSQGVPAIIIKFNNQAVYHASLLNKFERTDNYIKHLDLVYTAFKTLYLSKNFKTHKVSGDIKDVFIDLVILLYHGLYHLKITSHKAFTVEERHYVPCGWKPGNIITGPALIAMTDQSMHIIRTKFMYKYGLIALASLMQCFASQSVININSCIEARFDKLDDKPHDMTDEELIKMMNGDQDV